MKQSCVCVCGLSVNYKPPYRPRTFQRRDTDSFNMSMNECIFPNTHTHTDYYYNNVKTEIADHKFVSSVAEVDVS